MAYTQMMGRKPLGRERINITLPPDIASLAMQTANEQNRDRSALTEEALRLYLTNLGKLSKKKRGRK